ncbi:MAG: type II toxin-antitoxin system HicA family toxin [Chloroflexi bacterium]|nr:type II toxin-antitoxin system HicA family toxin [Chloroflexota bacterium]MBI3732373.1 type II toxin-antitoxin system HicA family toxin [Chloroflexota bacterium]
MPVFGPIKRRDLIRFLNELGFDGPYSGGRHQYMVKGQLSYDLLAKLLRQAGIDRDEWERR